MTLVRPDRTAVEPDFASTAAPTARHVGRGYAPRLLPMVVLVTLFCVAVAVPGLLVARVWAAAFLMTVPGAALLGATRYRPADGYLRLACTVAASLLLLMVIGLTASLWLPTFGVGRPLERWPMTIAVSAVTLALALVAAIAHEPIDFLLPRGVLRWRDVRFIAAVACIPVAAMLGAQVLNSGGSSALAAVALCAGGIALVVGLVRSERMAGWRPSLVLLATGVGALYSDSMRSHFLFGYDIQREYQAFLATFQRGSWTIPTNGDAYRSMLSITELPALMSHVSGVSGIYLFKVAYPLAFALFPVLVFGLVRRWLPGRPAFAVAGFLIVEPAFAQQFTALARQEIGMLFFGLLLAVAFDSSVVRRKRQVAIVAAGAGVAISHYTTAYILVACLVAAYLGALLYRLVRRESRGPMTVLALPVVVLVVGLVLVWNGLITDSAANVTHFGHEISSSGTHVLPNGKGRSLWSRWLVGNAPGSISAREYYTIVEHADRLSKPWIASYPSSVTNDYPSTGAISPSVAARLPFLHTALPKAATLLAELVIVATAVGVVAFAWRQRRRRSSDLEMAMFAGAFLAFLAFMRMSGAAILTYNPERGQLQGSIAVGVGLATAIAALLHRMRRAGTAFVAAALGLLFVTGSGLATLVAGGLPPANLSNRGEGYERFYVADEEVAAATWLEGHIPPKSIVWTDRYGNLRLISAGPENPNFIADLTPATIARDGYVFATTANVAGRARGAVDNAQREALYAFPMPFLNAEKNLVFSTSRTRIYR